jgi:hypothetical protein
VSPGGFGSVFGLDGQHAFGMESTPAWLSALHGGGGMHTPMAPGQLTPVGPSGGHNGGGGGGGGDGGGGSSHASFAALLSVISSAAYKGAHAGALSGAGSEIPGAIVKAAARLEGRFDDLENKFEEMREAGQAAAEAGQAAAEGTQAQVASVLAATHAVGTSVPSPPKRASAKSSWPISHISKARVRRSTGGGCPGGPPRPAARAVSPRATARAAGQFHHVPLCEQLVVLGFPVNEQSPMLDPKGTGLAKSMQPLLITYDQFGGP